MPLIILTGIPSSGKTTRALELLEFFTQKGKQVHIISENDEIIKANFDKNTFYSDSSKEKHIRGLLKSEVSRLITSSNVVILDALNYIKGYRYELYCASKANRSTQCTIHVQVPITQAKEFNKSRLPEAEKYSDDIFDALVMRFEEPDGKNRWDSPLFTVFPEQDLPSEEIMSALFDKAPPAPNMSTQNPPLSATNFLYDLDQTTKKITDCLVKYKSMGVQGSVKIDDYPDLPAVNVSKATVQQLMVLKRQYISYCKLHPPEPKSIPQLFVMYLEKNLQ